MRRIRPGGGSRVNSKTECKACIVELAHEVGEELGANHGEGIIGGFRNCNKADVSCIHIIDVLGVAFRRDHVGIATKMNGDGFQA